MIKFFKNMGTDFRGHTASGVLYFYNGMVGGGGKTEGNGTARFREFECIGK